MYKAIIIDDELPARRAIRALGEWEQYGIEIIAEADNGKQGLELLETEEPDLVFVDMKMPLMSGDEFLNKARILHQEACYIVISGFDDFAYARSAMQAGSVDYLLKPIRKADLNTAIGRAIAIIAERRERVLSESRSRIYRNLSAPLVKEKIYSSIIDKSGRFHHIVELRAVLDTEELSSLCRVVVFKLLNARDVIEQRFKNDSHAFYYALTNAVDELLDRFGKTFSFKNNRDESEIVAVIKLSGQADSLSIQVHELSAQLTSVFDVKLVAAEGPTASIESLGESYDAALRTLMDLNMIDLRPVKLSSSSSQKESDTDRSRSLLERSRLFIQPIESGSERQAMQELRKWLQELESTGVVTMSDMLAIEAELRMFAKSLLAQFKSDEQETADSIALFDRTLRRRVYEFAAFKEAVLDYFEPFFSVLAEAGRSGDNASIAEKIKAHIELHYDDELPVSFFAERYHMSKEHLARLFKQKYDIGIHEYQLQIRMSKAKEWLSDKSLKIQTVSERVGFRDQNYFSKAFKKYTGLTPQEFRGKMES
ncbi:two-component system response regulator YesN [Paenibacillus taihuensis]|uniref:Two-component system response regulator YesN n=1 Tax=Paenibacillus taihuensis TaxID=1156355 RepID=A0A3D9SA60_9BACL|nr:response regulator [Paenibacillus taihuensis]REE85367.1 two-component system response regulator YesN [Paenibacillus taihuensis]